MSRPWTILVAIVAFAVLIVAANRGWKLLGGATIVVLVGIAIYWKLVAHRDVAGRRRT